MEQSFIMDSDIIIIDKSLEVKDGCKVVAFIDGEYVLKTIRLGKNEVYLIPENPNYETITVTADQQFVIWGVVTYSIHKLY
jgi:DNA polymerase V